MRRSLLVFISGATQIFFALHVLLKIANINIIQLPSEAMFIPGIIIFLASGYLTVSYYFGDRKNNSALYDEYTAIRYYKLGAIGYAINGIGIFLIFSTQDYANWSLQAANTMIYQIASFAWLIFGVLLICFSIGDYKEARNG
jgi:uncharacterized protein with PQ loop repeat